MKSVVLDSSALLAFLQKEPGYEKVVDLFARASESGRPLLMTSVNWGEVMYIIIARQGADAWRLARYKLMELPLSVIAADETLAESAAHIKATTKLPYADCFAAALAKLKKAELVTEDKDFRELERAIKIAWVRDG